MIRPPRLTGAAFTDAADGDIRHDLSARAAVSRALGISAEWAHAHQVHGSEARRVEIAGSVGDADALWTTQPGLPIAIFTADCLGVALLAEGAVGVAHAGWRGARKGVVEKLRSAMAAGGHAPLAAAVGPGIGPCCFEVGDEVAVQFPDADSVTTWGNTSVDLRVALTKQLDGVEVWMSDQCTYHDEGWFSHRLDADTRRMATVAWVP